MSEEFDPTAPEGARPSGSQYVSKKDIRLIAIVLVVCGLLGIPTFKILEKRAWKTECANNLRSISTAMQAYAVSHEERFPPVFAEGQGGGFPLVFPESSSVYTWASEISPGMNPRSSFLCPAAQEAESVSTISDRPIDTNDPKDRDRTKGQERLSYGMYMAYSGFGMQLVPDPNQTVIISETSNMGTRGTLDPLPFKDVDGNTVPFDAFAIGWDNSNSVPDAKTTSVTRLAFYADKSGSLSDMDARHDFEVKNGSVRGLHGLTASGSSIVLKPGSAGIRQTMGITGMWAVPSSLGR